MAVRRVQAYNASVLLDITVSTTITPPFETQGAQYGSIKMPAALTSTTLTYQVSHDGSNYAALLTGAGAAFGNVAVGANVQVPLPREALCFPRVRLVFGTAEAANRTVSLRLEA